MSLQQIQLRDLLLIVDWNIVDFRNWHDRNLPGQEIAIFFSMLNDPFSAYFRLTQRYATILQEFLMTIYLRSILFIWQEQYISKPCTKKRSVCFVTLLFALEWISGDSINVFLNDKNSSNTY